MSRKKRLDSSTIAADRLKENLNQRDFWSRYGVTRSGGSCDEIWRRFERTVDVYSSLEGRQGTAGVRWSA